MSANFNRQLEGLECLEYLKPYVRQCGDRRRPAWRIGGRKLLDYLLVYIEEGQGEFVVGGHKYEAREGDVFWIPPDVLHIMEGHPPSMVCPYVHFDLIYRGEVSQWDFSIPEGMVDLDDFARLMHPDMSGTFWGDICGRLRLYNYKVIGRLVREVCAEAVRAHPYSFLRMSGLMLEVLAEVYRGCTGLSAEYESYVTLLEEAADYMQKNCAEDIEISQLCGICNLSGSYFRRLFKKHFACSPRQYLRKCRIYKAKVLMVGSDLNLSEIALRVGFANVHNLSRAFREVEGVAPSVYRLCGEASINVELRKRLSDV